MASNSPTDPVQVKTALEELDKLYVNSSQRDPDLIRLLAEGPRILQEVSNAKSRLAGDNVDARCVCVWISKYYLLSFGHNHPTSRSGDQQQKKNIELLGANDLVAFVIFTCWTRSVA